MWSTFIPSTESSPLMMHSFRPVPSTMASYSSSMAAPHELDWISGPPKVIKEAPGSWCGGVSSWRRQQGANKSGACPEKAGWPAGQSLGEESRALSRGSMHRSKASDRVCLYNYQRPSDYRPTARGSSRPARQTSAIHPVCRGGFKNPRRDAADRGPQHPENGFRGRLRAVLLRPPPRGLHPPCRAARDARRRG